MATKLEQCSLKDWHVALVASAGAAAVVVAVILATWPIFTPGPTGPFAPTLQNTSCTGTVLGFDIVNRNDFSINVQVDYGPAWSGYGDFWTPRKNTSHYFVDQGVSCAGALPLTIQSWSMTAEETCSRPPDQCPRSEPPAGANAPTVQGASCLGTKLGWDVVNPNVVNIEVQIDYGPSWSGWGNFWAPRQATSHFFVDQGVSCEGALPLTIMGWIVSSLEACTLPPDQCPR